MYYYIRNRFSIHKAKFNVKAIAINYCCFWQPMAGGDIVPKTNKLKNSISYCGRQPMPLWIIFCHARFNTGKVKNKIENSFNENFTGSFRTLWSLLFASIHG